MTLEMTSDTPSLPGKTAQESEGRLPTEIPPVAVVPRLVSILVPCCGQLEYTQLCVPSLLRHSRAPCELVFLDIGSLDGTVEYLKGVAAAASLRVVVIRASTDGEIPVAVQSGLVQARGEFLVLLNNDTVVVPDWLDQLIALARTSPSIGVVGPMSNYASPPQWVETVPYHLAPKKAVEESGSALVTDGLLDVREVEQFSRAWREEHRGKWMETEQLGGFCLLIKRDVLTKLGSLVTQAGLNVFDTEALCRRIRQAGYSLAVCRDLFIHHFGSRTFAHGGPAVT